jgi:hypothetical protein
MDFGVDEEEIEHTRLHRLSKPTGFTAVRIQTQAEEGRTDATTSISPGKTPRKNQPNPMRTPKWKRVLTGLAAPPLICSEKNSWKSAQGGSKGEFLGVGG